MPTYESLLFDLDDTLIDFKASESSALALVYENFYRAFAGQDAFHSRFHAINQSLWKAVESMQLPVGQVRLKRFQLLSEALGVNLDTEPVAAFYEHQLGTTARWLPGTAEALSLLGHHYKLGIVTNGLTPIQRAKHQHLSLGTWFKSFVVSEEVGMSKPQKEIFHLALTELETAPARTLMVGDSLTSDYQGALNAGMDFCWINAKRLPLPAHLPEPRFTLPSVAELPALLR
jgi:2-haloacid dehalogenase/putative hydrolase of the HAD superfamily